MAKLARVVVYAGVASGVGPVAAVGDVVGDGDGSPRLGATLDVGTPARTEEVFVGVALGELVAVGGAVGTRGTGVAVGPSPGERDGAGTPCVARP